MLSTNLAHQSTNFRLSIACIKTHLISHVLLQTKNPFFFKVLIALQCHER